MLSGRRDRYSKARLASLLTLVAVLSVVVPALNVHATAILTTDQSDYLGGSVVTIYGGGFASTSIVNVKVTDPNGNATNWSVNSDSSGSLATTYQLHHVNGTYIVSAYDNFGNSATTTFHDAAEAANLSQCTNGTIGPPLALSPCINGVVSGVSYSDWVNGNANGAKSHWREGDFIAYRVAATGLSPGSHTLDFQYDTVHNNVHAIDYLGSANSTETFSTTPSLLHSNNNNPCIDSFNASVVTVWCIPASPAGSIVIPAPSLINCNGSMGTFAGSQIPGKVFVWGPPGTSLDSFTYTSQNVPYGTGQCKTTVELGFHSGFGGSTVVFTWGGHIASQSNWGLGNSASAISGSPYHMALNSLDTATSGSQDRALSSSAIYFTPGVSTIVQNAAGTAVTSVTVGTSVHDTAYLTNSSSSAGGSATYSLWNTGTCSGTKLSSWTVSVNSGLIPNSGSFTPTSVGSYSFNITYAGDASDYKANGACEPFTVTLATSIIATTVAPTTITLGSTNTSARDTATISNGSNPSGSITFTVYNNPTCTGTPVFTSSPVTVTGNGAYTSPAFTPSATGTYYWIASYTGDSNNLPAKGHCGDNGEVLSVQSAGPGITTSVSPPTITLASPGSSASDTATLSGGFSPTGTISFNVFSNNACIGTPVFTSTIPVNGNGNYVSGSFTPTGVGAYNWVASYSGDSNNNPFTAPCGATGETLTVQPASPGITTQATPSTMALTTPAGTASDTATLTLGYNPTGTITFTVFTACGGASVFSATVSVNGNGNYVSPPFIPQAAGTYHWVASYSGDTQNNPYTATCGANGETLVVQQASPTITTQVSPSTITLTTTSSPATDTATLSGAYGTPVGSITFSVYASQTCTGSPIFTGTISVSGNGNYASSPFTPAGAGIYNWIAAYSGDANNKPYSAPCGANGETLLVLQSSPVISTQVSPTNIVLTTTGSPTTDTATLSGGFGSPTGTITFNVFANAACSGSSVFSSTINVNGNGNYASAPFNAPGAGTYSWVASYSGDSNNNPYSAACGANGETLVVTPASPSIATAVSPSTITLTTGAATATDTATLSGAFGTPTGTLTFSVYSSVQFCTGTALFTSVVAVSGNGNYVSGAFTPPGAGSYNWRVVYSGDSNNNQFTAPCGAAGETLTVLQASPTITTQAFPATITLGSGPSSAQDTATLSGGFGSPSRTITFSLYSASANCLGTPLFTSNVAVNGNGNYSSSSYSPTGVGIYQWQASYSGDANNNPYSSPCSESGETVTVVSASPAISTTVSPSSISSVDSATDTAILSGGFNPTGTITFTVFSQNANCTGTPLFTSTVSVSGNGNYLSGPFHPTGVGIFNWVASYSGDSNNNPFTAPCGANGETLTVTVATPGIATSATPSTTTLPSSSGNTAFAPLPPVSDVATIAGGFNPTGTITFSLYSGSGGCTGTPLYTNTVTVNGNGNYASGSYIPYGAGSYNWQAIYSGDTNNAGFTAPCVVTSETLTINKASPTITTNILNPNGTDVTGQTVYPWTPIYDTSVITGGYAPQGNVTYYFYGSNQCSGTAISAQTVTMVQGTVPGTNPQALTLGSFGFVAVYGGDANNNAARGACEPISVTKVNTSTSTIVWDDTIGRPVALDGWVSTTDTFHDTATLSGGINGFVINGTATYYFYTTGDCSGSPTSQTTVIVTNGSVPNSNSYGPLLFGTYSFKTVYNSNAYYSSSTAPCEPFTTAPPSIVTDTMFCRLPNNQFVLNFLTDPKNPAAYRLVSTNPGQFYDNVFDTGTPGSTASLTISMPFPFDTQGAVPIQVSSNVQLVNGCFQPSFDLTSQFTITTSSGRLSTSGAPVILFSDYSPQALNSTQTITLTGPVPATGLVYVTIHMDYGLRNQDFYKTTQGAQWTTNLAVTLASPQNYQFTVSGSMTSTTSAASVNNIKKDPGYAGVVTDSYGNPVAGANVKIYDSNGSLIASGVTDTNGVYVISYKYTGSQTLFTIKVSSSLFPGIVQTAAVLMKSNQMTLTNFVL